MNTPLSMLRRSIDRHGFAGSLVKLLRRYVYRKEVDVVLARDVHSGATQFGRPGRYEVRFLSYPEDFELMRRAEKGRASGFRGWAEQGAVVMAAIRDGELAAMVSLVSGPFREPYLNYRFALSEDEWLWFAGWVSPAHRTTSALAQMLNLSMRHILEHGGKRMITCIDVNNTKSLKIMRHIGFEEIGRELIVRRLLGLCWTRSANYSGHRFDHLRRRRKTLTTSAVTTEAMHDSVDQS